MTIDINALRTAARFVSASGAIGEAVVTVHATTLDDFRAALDASPDARNIRVLPCEGRQFDGFDVYAHGCRITVLGPLRPVARDADESGDIFLDPSTGSWFTCEGTAP